MPRLIVSPPGRAADLPEGAPVEPVRPFHARAHGNRPAPHASGYSRPPRDHYRAHEDPLLAKPAHPVPHPPARGRGRGVAIAGPDRRGDRRGQPRTRHLRKASEPWLLPVSPSTGREVMSVSCDCGFPFGHRHCTSGLNWSFMGAA